ncbi:hypothetical protein D3C71_1409520 [compost metagenome]
MAPKRVASSTVKPVIQRRRWPGPGSSRPNNAGVNSDTSDDNMATLPLATSE